MNALCFYAKQYLGRNKCAALQKTPLAWTWPGMGKEHRAKATCVRSCPIYLLHVLFAMEFLPEIPVMVQARVSLQLLRCQGTQEGHTEQPSQSA